MPGCAVPWPKVADRTVAGFPPTPPARPAPPPSAAPKQSARSQGHVYTHACTNAYTPVHTQAMTFKSDKKPDKKEEARVRPFFSTYMANAAGRCRFEHTDRWDSSRHSQRYRCIPQPIPPRSCSEIKQDPRSSKRRWADLRNYVLARGYIYV